MYTNIFQIYSYFPTFFCRTCKRYLLYINVCKTEENMKKYSLFSYILTRYKSIIINFQIFYNSNIVLQKIFNLCCKDYYDLPSYFNCVFQVSVLVFGMFPKF